MSKLDEAINEAMEEEQKGAAVDTQEQSAGSENTAKEMPAKPAAKAEDKKAQPPAVGQGPKTAATKQEQAQQKQEAAVKDAFVEYLKAEQKDKYGKLTPEAQAIIKELHKDLQSGFTKQSQKYAAFEKEAKEFFGQLQPMVRGRYKDLGEFLTYLHGVQEFERELAQDPQRTILTLMQRAQLTPEQLEQYQPNPAAEAVRPLQREIEALKDLLGKQAAPADAAKQTAPGQEDDVEAQLGAFKDAVDDKGALLHPHFEKVAPIMAHIMARDGHEDMDKAYKEAVLTIPEVREAEQKAYADKVLKEQSELNKAKRAGSINIKSSFVNGAERTKRTLDDIITETMDASGI